MSISTQSHGAATGEDDSNAPSISSTGALPDRYRIERQSGSPSAGTRLVATDSETGERFFIKCAPTSDAIRHEAEILSALDHPGIVRLKSWRAEPESAFLTLEIVNGPDLEAFMARQGGRLAATAAAIFEFSVTTCWSIQRASLPVTPVTFGHWLRPLLRGVIRSG